MHRRTRGMTDRHPASTSGIVERERRGEASWRVTEPIVFGRSAAVMEIALKSCSWHIAARTALAHALALRSIRRRGFGSAMPLWS